MKEKKKIEYLEVKKTIIVRPGRARDDFEIGYDGIRDVLKVVDKKEKKMYQATPSAFLKILFDIELEEVEYLD